VQVRASAAELHLALSTFRSGRRVHSNAFVAAVLRLHKLADRFVVILLLKPAVVPLHLRVVYTFHRSEQVVLYLVSFLEESLVVEEGIASISDVLLRSCYWVV